MTSEVTKSPAVLFLSLSNNDGANVPVAEFGRLGFECVVMSPPGFTCAQSRFVSRHIPLPRNRGLWLGVLGVRPALERAVRDLAPSLVVPLDDIAAWLLRGLVRSGKVGGELRRLLEASLGAPSGYEACCSRARFLELATRVGVRAPRSRAATPASAAAAAAEVGFPVVLKLEHSCSGFGVTIANDAAELRRAVTASGYGRWRAQTGIWALLRRAKEAMRRFAWRRVGLDDEAETDFEIQQYIRGVPAMRMVATWQGRILAGASFEKLCVNPRPFGASTVVRGIEHPEMDEAVRRLVAAVGCSGFASFDFMIEAATGHAYVIEMNPRTTSSIHLGRLCGQDICGALAGQISGALAAAEAVRPKRETRPIASFPRELDRDPESAWLREASAVIHDVPWDDRPVFELYYRRLLRRHPAHAATIARRLGMPIPVPQPKNPDRFWHRVGIGVKQ